MGKLTFYKSIGYTLVCLIWIMGSCASSPAKEEELPEPTERIISFSGYEWVVRNSGIAEQGPGPNLFSDSKENVWVDNQGRLHLKIIEKGGSWYCSGITLKHSLSYGKYVFYLASDVSLLDQHVVGGLFTYMNDQQEIDIEFSRWSDPENQDGQFAVQPSAEPENKERFDLDRIGEQSTHVINWQAKSINFISRRGHGLQVDDSNLIHQWNYTGDDIPPDNEERLKINLWLFRGQAPSDGQAQEMIIEKVEYIP